MGNEKKGPVENNIALLDAPISCTDSTKNSDEKYVPNTPDNNIKILYLLDHENGLKFCSNPISKLFLFISY